VRYGKGNYWVYKVFKAGEVPCIGSVFGDPLAHKAKECYQRMDTQMERWYPCAKEGQKCKGWPGNHKIRYGANGKYTFMETSGVTPCNNDEFGDPAPGMEKQCFVLEKPEKAGKKQTGGKSAPSNLAFGQTTEQISISPWSKKKNGSAGAAFDGQPSRAVDGNTNGNYGAGSCTHTFAQKNPWWRVELKERSYIYEVHIFARTDAVENCGHGKAKTGPCALSDIQVYVGDKPYWYGDKPCNSPMSITKEAAINCKKKVGKYVFVKRSGMTSLSLCEVKVIGIGVAQSGGNVANIPGSKSAKSRYDVQPSNGWLVSGLSPRAGVERECAECRSNFCMLSGVFKQPADIQPSAVSVIGKAPSMCHPQKKHTFQVSNAVTGTADITVMPNGDISCANIRNKVSSEKAAISLNGVYYLTHPDEGESGKSDEVDDSGASPADGWYGFRHKKLGPYCLLYGLVGGEGGGVVGSVPSHCRPTQKLVFHASSSAEKVWISIHTDGIVRLETSGPVAPKYEKAEGWNKGGSPKTLDANAWINPLSTLGNFGLNGVAGANGTNGLVCDKDGQCTGVPATVPEPPLTEKVIYEKESSKKAEPNVASKASLEKIVKSAMEAADLAKQAASAADVTSGFSKAGKTARRLVKKASDVAKAAYEHTSQQTQEAQAEAPAQGAAVSLLQTFETHKSLAIGTRDQISVHLDGIIYSVVDHHPFDRVKRAGKLTDDEKAAFNAQNSSKFPSPDECAKPKVTSKNFEEAYDSETVRISHFTKTIHAAVATGKDSVTAAQFKRNKAHIRDLRKKREKLFTNHDKTRSKEVVVKKEHILCFVPRPAAAQQLSKNQTIENPSKAMCSEAWNSTLPDCCSQGCSESQLKQISGKLILQVTSVKTTKAEYANKRDAANKKLYDDATAELEELVIKSRLATAAAQDAKQKHEVQNLATVLNNSK